MENRKFDQDVVNDSTVTQSHCETSSAAMLLDAFLNEMLENRKTEELRKEIDRALDARDKKLFMELSSRLKAISDT